MQDKTFRRMLWAVLAVGLAVTMVHVLYAAQAYQSASITYFIGHEWW